MLSSAACATSKSDVRPVYLGVRAASQYSGLSRSRLYELFPRLDVRKDGRRTLISRASLDALLEGLPRFRGVTQKQPAADTNK
jgi:hypothetical protein